MKHLKSKDFGLNVITEVDKAKEVKDNDKNYETGEFTKRYNDDYTDDAIIFQSILEYSKKISMDQHFTNWDITKYLVQPKNSDCKVYKELYSGDNEKTKIDARTNNNLNRINNLLEKLVYLELIGYTTGPSNNKIQTKKYYFT